MDGKRAIKFIREKYSLLTAKKFSTIAGTLVYFFIMSVVPFVFWLTFLFGRLLSENYSAILSLKIFSGFEKLVEYIVESASSAAGDAGVVLIITTLYSSTNLFYHIRRSGEFIYGTEGGNGFKVRLAALLLMLCAVIAMAITIAFFSAAYYVIYRYVGGLTAEIALYAFLLAAAFLIAIILNLYICPFRVKITEVIIGAAVTTFLWAASAAAFVVYLYFANIEKLYGAVSAAVVFLLWLYVMMNCFVIGAVFNSDRIIKTHCFK